MNGDHWTIASGEEIQQEALPEGVMGELQDLLDRG